MKRALGPICFALALASGCAGEDLPNVGQETAELSAFARSIQNHWTGWCMDIPWGNAFVGQIVNEFPCHGGASQQFVVEPISGVVGNVHIRFNNSSLCVAAPGLFPGSTGARYWLELVNCSDDDGTTLSGGWQASSWPTQTYCIGRSCTDYSRPLNAGETLTNITFRRFQAPSYCMDAPGSVPPPSPNPFGSNWNGNPLQAYYQCHGGSNQSWDIRN